MINSDNTLRNLVTSLKKYDEELVEQVYEEVKHDMPLESRFSVLAKEVRSRIDKMVSDNHAADLLQHQTRNKLLEDAFPKVVANEVYRAAFPENSLESSDELEEHTGKGNAIRMDVINRWFVDEHKDKHVKITGVQSVVTEDLIGLMVMPKAINTDNLLFSNTNLNTYFGNRRLTHMIDKIHGFIIEVDDVISEEQINAFVSKLQSGLVPIPNYLVNSGHGFHIYYILDKPVDFHNQQYAVKPVLTNILTAIRNLWWTADVSDTKPETIDINKAFTIIGTSNRKNKDLLVTAFRTGSVKCSLEFIRSFIDEPDDNKDYDISFPRRSKYSKEECISLFPNWAVTIWPEEFDEETRSRLLNENETNRKRKASVERIIGDSNYSVCSVSLYNWFYRLISNPKNIKHGNRYKCMLCLAIYGVKCNVSQEQVRQDLEALLPLYNSIEKKYYDEKFILNQVDINNALSVYKRPLSNLYTYEWIMENTGIEYEPMTRRRPKGERLTQAEHLKLARESLDKSYPNGSWRAHSDGETKRKILAFIHENPSASIKDCISGGICSQSSAYKYWDYCRRELGLDNNKPMTSEERIKQYRKEKPTATKAQCIRELGLSKPTVYKHW